MRGDIGTAASAGPKSGCLRGAGRRIEADILGAWRLCRTDRPAVYAGRSHARKEPPVEAGVAALDRAVAGVEVDIHAVLSTASTRLCWRFSDMVMSADERRWGPEVGFRAGVQVYRSPRAMWDLHGDVREKAAHEDLRLLHGRLGGKI